MSKEFSEDKLIQASAAELLEKELGWTAVYAFDEVLGLDGTLGRTSYKQVLLPERPHGDDRRALLKHGCTTR